MGLIAKIKSLLPGASNGQERPRDRHPSATADDEPEASAERAVKGVDEEPTASAAGAQREDGGAAAVEEPAAEEPVGATSEPSVAEEEPAGASGESVESIKGIGSAYAQRLADAGVGSVAELARADAEELAAATDLGTGRVAKWIERARARTE